MPGPAEGIVLGLSLSLVYTFGSTNVALGPLKLSEWLSQEQGSHSQSTAFIARKAALYQTSVCYLGRCFSLAFLGVGTGVMRKGVTQEATDRACPAPG